jgi:hypothetical protein
MPNDPLLADDPDGCHPKVLVVNGERPLFCNAMRIEATNQT